VISGHTEVYALLGHPVRHSLSPQIHNTWFQRYDIDAVYVALEIERLDLSSLPLAGYNLTVPFKTAVIEQLDQASEVVRRLGAANTVVRREGRLFGTNTDGDGFAEAFETELGAALAGRRTLVLGAGGAARAVAAACADRGIPEVCFANRTAERADEAIAQLAPHYPNTRFSRTPLAREAFADHAPQTQLVVNCTSGAAAETLRDFDISPLPQDAVWVDINYWMADPPQLDACRQRGLTVQNGVSMLVYQAARAFEAFTGVRPQVTEVLELLRSHRRR